MPDSPTTFAIEADVPPRFRKSLRNFIFVKYVKPQSRVLTNASISDAGENPTLSYSIRDGTGMRRAEVDITVSLPLKLEVTWLSPPVMADIISGTRLDISIVVKSFEEQLENSSIFFAWREGEKIVPERLKGSDRHSLSRIFLETQILFFLVLIIASIFVYQVLGLLTPLILLAAQFIFVFYSSKIVARTADWHIDKANPYIDLMEFRLPLDEHDEFKKKLPTEKLTELKRRAYDEVISKGGSPGCANLHEIFQSYGIDCEAGDFVVRRTNVYDLVKKTADKFKFPMPEIVISNAILPNAAASGPSPNRGVVLITTGLLVHLDEEEIISVLGHEFGHLMGRDPLALYGLTTIQYLLLFYVFFPFFSTSILLFLIYYWAIMGITYFVAKFFEARADLISAIVIGKPDVLARSLEKIGSKRLLYEQIPSFRTREWLSFDPHPPLYFRIKRLKDLVPPVVIKHPLAQSARDVIRGFLFGR
jgi:heat shock protein HtpX